MSAQRLPLPPCEQRAEPAPRLLIVDIENLLLDPTIGVQQSLRHALQCMMVEVPPHAFRHWSPRTPLHETLAILMNCRDVRRLAQAREYYDAHFDEHGRYGCRLRRGALALMQQLTESCELHYLTHIGAAAAARLLDAHGLGRFVRSIFSSEVAESAGVRPHLIRQLVAGSGAPPSRWALLSDHPLELKAAQALNLRTIALGYGRTPLPILLQLRPAAIAADLPDIVFEIERWPTCSAARTQSNDAPRTRASVSLN